jgi:hypothetical protein
MMWSLGNRLRKGIPRLHENTKKIGSKSGDGVPLKQISGVAQIKGAMCAPHPATLTADDIMSHS